jgi:hypothetical protein
MPTATAPAARETWRDWMSPDAPEPTDDELMTRSEFVTAVQERTPHILETTIATWERAGALPRPVRRWFRGATRATYPRWLVDLAAAIPTLRAEGNSLADIGERFREAVFAQKTAANSGLIRIHQEATIYKTAAPDAFAAALAAIARRFEALTDRPVIRIELNIFDGNGDRDEFTYPS